MWLLDHRRLHEAVTKFPLTAYEPQDDAHTILESLLRRNEEEKLLLLSRARHRSQSPSGSHDSTCSGPSARSNEFGSSSPEQDVDGQDAGRRRGSNASDLKVKLLNPFSVSTILRDSPPPPPCPPDQESAMPPLSPVSSGMAVPPPEATALGYPFFPMVTGFTPQAAYFAYAQSLMNAMPFPNFYSPLGSFPSAFSPVQMNRGHPLADLGAVNGRTTVTATATDMTATRMLNPLTIDAVEVKKEPAGDEPAPMEEDQMEQMSCFQSSTSGTKKEDDSSKSDTFSQHSKETREVCSSSPLSTSVSSSCSPKSVALPLDENVKCVVCDDTASGYHYGVISCEGCKGFFRRTVQRDIHYWCHKNGGCSVTKLTRNRCQACRFRKCLATGMTKESVRQDKNRKRKLKASDDSAVATAQLQQTIRSIVKAYTENFDDLQNGQKDRLQRTRAFASSIPGFSELPEEDRNLLCQLGSNRLTAIVNAFNSCSKENLVIKHGNMNCDDRKMFASISKLTNAMKALEVTTEEVAILCAICLLREGVPELHTPLQVEKIQETCLEALHVQVHLTPCKQSNVFAKLLMTLSDTWAISSKTTAPLNYTSAAEDRTAS